MTTPTTPLPQEPQWPLYYIGGPYPSQDGAYAVCETATGRVLRLFKGHLRVEADDEGFWRVFQPSRYGNAIQIASGFDLCEVIDAARAAGEPQATVAKPAEASGDSFGETHALGRLRLCRLMSEHDFTLPIRAFEELTVALTPAALAAREPVHSEDTLLQALERVTDNFRALLSRKPVHDADETLAECDVALAAAKGKAPGAALSAPVGAETPSVHSVERSS